MDNIYDIIIVGAGPAGLSSAIYGLRANKKVLVIEKSAPGGQLLNIKQIENYPGYMGDGVTLALKMFEQFNRFKGQLIIDEVIEIIHGKVNEVKTTSSTYYANNVIVASGTKYANLKVNGEAKFIGNGISYCAICDGKFYQNKDIMVVIDKLDAIEDLKYLASLANKIYLLTNLEINEKFDNVEIINGYKIKSLLGDKKLEGVVIKNNDNEEITLNVNAIFPLIGELPSNSILRKYDIFSSNGYMKVDSNNETPLSGIFAVGDVVDKKLRQVVNACSEGAIASSYIITKR